MTRRRRPAADTPADGEYAEIGTALRVGVEEPVA